MPSRIPKIDFKKLRIVRVKGDRLVLLLCIAAALVLWFVSKMSKTYTDNFEFSVHVLPPDGYDISTNVPDKASASLRGSGWDLMGLGFRGYSDTILIRPANITVSQISESSLKQRINDALQKEAIEVVHVYPDRISLSFDRQVRKQIVVKPAVQFTIAPDHKLIRPPYTEPASIEARGAESILSDLDTVATVAIDLGQIDESVSRNLPLDLQLQDMITYSPTSVQLILQVEAITQQTWILPIQVVGADTSYTLLPDKVLLKGKVGLSLYDSIKPDDFRFYVDVSELNRNNQLVIHYDSLPPSLEYINHSPKVVEYYRQLPSDTLSIERNQ